MTKNKTFPLNQNLACANCVFYLAVVWYAMNSTLAKLVIYFPWDGHRTAALGTNRITDWQWPMALSRHCLKNQGIVNKPPLREAYTFTFVEKTSFQSLNICEDTVSGIANSVRKVICRTWCPMWSNCYFLFLTWSARFHRPVCDALLFTPSKRLKAYPRDWLPSLMQTHSRILPAVLVIKTCCFGLNRSVGFSVIGVSQIVSMF